MRSLVVDHREEGATRISPLDEVDRLVSDNVGHVALLNVLALGVDECGIKVLALPRKDVPFVEAGRFVSRAFAEVVLAK